MRALPNILHDISHFLFVYLMQPIYSPELVLPQKQNITEEQDPDVPNKKRKANSSPSPATKKKSKARTTTTEATDNEKHVSEEDSPGTETTAQPLNVEPSKPEAMTTRREAPNKGEDEDTSQDFSPPDGSPHESNTGSFGEVAAEEFKKYNELLTQSQHR